MANTNKNITEMKAAIDADLVATVDLSILNPTLKTDIINDLVPRKDRIANGGTGTGGALDFEDYETIYYTTTGSATFSFSNLADGDTRYLYITKTAGHTLSFTAATNITAYQTNIDINATVVTYEIKNKNSVVTVKALYQDIVIGDFTDITSGDKYKIPRCEDVKIYTLDDGITFTTNATNWTEINANAVLKFNDVACIDIELTAKASTSATLGTVSINGYPDDTILVSGNHLDKTGSIWTPVTIQIASTGQVTYKGSIALEATAKIYLSVTYANNF